MQLSSQARKAMAAGLAASTILWSAIGIVPQLASAAVHSDGCVVLSGGVVWLITGGTRRGFTSAEVFQSSGYNFSQVVSATAEDVALPVGPIMTYADGTLVKGPNDPLVYLVAGGQKRPFVSGSVFTGLGYSFANIQQAPVNTFSDLPTGSNLDSTTIAHPAGTLVISNSAIWQMSATGRMGFSSMAVFDSLGLMLSHVVAANAADLAMPDQGAVVARAACTEGSGPTPPPVSGSINISLSGPAATTFINDQSQANLADFVFTGSGTVTGVTLVRTGISADTSLSNVYLFDGTTRLTDSASVTSGSVINFTNSNGLFTVAGSRTISARADMAATSGETVGVKLTAVTLSSGTVGGLPVMGNNHSIATASLADVNLASALTISDTDPGIDIVVFQGNAAVTTRDVTLTRLAVRQIGSIQSADIKNFRLYVDGVQVATQAALDTNGYVTFTLSKTLTSGTRVIKIVADVIGGSGRNVQMSLRGAYDITVVDTQYNAAPIVTATGSFPFGDSTTFSINSGTVTAVKAADAPSKNLTVGASDVPIGRWTITAFGEAVKIETLAIGVDTTGGTTSEHTLRNGRVMINGAQYGSTTNVAAADAFATSQSYTVNYTAVPGTPVAVEFRADMFDSEGTDNIGNSVVTSVQAALVGSATSNNAIPQVSLGTLDVPGSNQTANDLTVASGTISLTRLASYPNQTTAVPQSSYKLGQWTLTGNSAEAVNVNTFAVGFVGTDAWDPSDDLTNVFVKYDSSTSSIKGTVADGSTTNLANTWSQAFTLGVDASINVELWGTIASSATDSAGAADTMIPYLRVTGITALSGTSVYADTDTDSDNTDAGSTGQTVTAGSGTLTATKDASSVDSKLVDDTGTVQTVAWKFAAVTDTFTITDLSFSLGDATAVSSVAIKDGSTTIATKPGATSMSYSGLEIPVAANTNKVLSVELTMAMIGVGGGTSDVALTTTMVAFTARNSSGTTDASAADAGPSIEANPAGNAMYAYKAVPLVSVVALPNADLAAGAGKVIAKFTVSSNGTGTVAWKQAMFEINKTATPTLASVALHNADTGEAITSAKVFQNGTGGVATTCVADNTFCELLISVGTNADDDVVEQVSGAKTYEVRATIGGAIAATDSVSVTLDRNTTTKVAAAIYTTADNSLAAGNVSFVWSDESNSATSDTGVATWLPDFLVKNLALNWSLN